MRTSLVLFSLVALSALPACVREIPTTERACPCAQGLRCCAALAICLRPTDVCPTEVDLCTPGSDDCPPPAAPLLDGYLNEPAWKVDRPMLFPAVVDVDNGKIINNKASFGWAWNSQYLFVGVRVTDQEPLWNDSPAAWQDDGIEIYIDGNNSRGMMYDSHDLQIVGRFDGSPLEIYDGTVKPPTRDERILHAASTSKGAFEVEVAIPWARLDVTPVLGMSLGLAVANDDDDDGMDRDSQLTSEGNVDNWRFPYLFGTVVLTQDKLVGPSPGM